MAWMIQIIIFHVFLTISQGQGNQQAQKVSTNTPSHILRRQGLVENTDLDKIPRNSAYEVSDNFRGHLLGSQELMNQGISSESEESDENPFYYYIPKTSDEYGSSSSIDEDDINEDILENNISIDSSDLSSDSQNKKISSNADVKREVFDSNEINPQHKQDSNSRDAIEYQNVSELSSLEEVSEKQEKIPLVNGEQTSNESSYGEKDTLSDENDSSVEINKHKDENIISSQPNSYYQFPSSNQKYYTAQLSNGQTVLVPVSNNPMYIPSDQNTVQGQILVPGNGQQYIANSQPIQDNGQNYVISSQPVQNNGQQYVTSSIPVQSNGQQYYVLSNGQPALSTGQQYVLSNGQQFVTGGGQPYFLDNGQQYITKGQTGNGQEYIPNNMQVVPSNGQILLPNNGQQYVQPMQSGGQQYVSSNGQNIAPSSYVSWPYNSDQNTVQNNGQVYVPINGQVQPPQSNIITVPSGSVVTVGDNVPFVVYKDKEDKLPSMSSLPEEDEDKIKKL